ncbi:MAG: SRPBCC family protein [Burkholderiales bacterium]
MRKAALAVLLLSLSAFAFAHGPSRQKVVENVTIKAAPDAVWAKVKDFAKLQDWHPAVESSTATDGSKVGSVRTLSLKGGGKVVETLEGFSEEDKKFNYRAKDGGALPVSNYTSTLTVKAGEAPGTSTVEWRGAFYRAYPNNNPPPEQNDEAAVKAITGVYQTGLANLKKSLEK